MMHFLCFSYLRKACWAGLLKNIIFLQWQNIAAVNVQLYDLGGCKAMHKGFIANHTPDKSPKMFEFVQNWQSVFVFSRGPYRLRWNGSGIQFWQRFFIFLRCVLNIVCVGTGREYLDPDPC